MKDQLKNALSSVFGPSFAAEAIPDGQGSISREFVFGLTYEKKDTHMANQKYRCLLICKDQLEQIAKLESTASVAFEATDTAGRKYAEYRLQSLRELRAPGWRREWVLTPIPTRIAFAFTRPSKT